MTPEEDKLLVETLETLYSMAIKLQSLAASLEQRHRAYLVETLAPQEMDDE